MRGMPLSAPKDRTVGASIAPDELLSFETALQRERELLAGLGAGEHAPLFLVWRTPKALIMPRGMGAKPGVQDAATEMARQGWPVHERDTGGDLSPQSPGIVNLSLAFRDESASPSIGCAYVRLLESVNRFLTTEFDIEATATAVPGSFCDGAYNVVVDGRKLGGTAQRWRMVRKADGAGGADVLAHVALLCSLDLVEAVCAINTFYALCGIEKRVEAERHVTLAELAGSERARPDAVAAKLGAFLASWMPEMK